MTGVRAEFFFEVPDSLGEAEVFAWLKELAIKNKGELIAWR